MKKGENKSKGKGQNQKFQAKVKSDGDGEGDQGFSQGRPCIEVRPLPRGERCS